ncbi:MAG: hypothetical protein QOI45_395, partial [Thermoleophilaceae bacterium]|nr:hypothetical protein [Thermoleophilaceae bacterium]
MSFEPRSGGQRWLQDQWLDIVEGHRFEWVAADAEGVFANGSLDEVIAIADDRYSSWNEVA